MRGTRDIRLQGRLGREREREREGKRERERDQRLGWYVIIGKRGLFG